MEIQRVRVNLNLWKTNLTREITNLEDNLDQIYYTAGLKPHRIVTEDVTEESVPVISEKGDYESIVNEQVNEVKQAVDNICALISSVTEFDLPIPVDVLLRIASRIGSIRSSDFTKKVPGSIAKKYVYAKKSLELIESSLHMYKWISIILGTNILPFQPHINQNLMSLLEWTRTSNLQKHNELQYYAIRCQVIGNITETLEQLSLNVNLDSPQLETLVDLELVKSLEDSVNTTTADVTSIDKQNKNSTAATFVVPSPPIASLQPKVKYISDALVCLDRLFIVYADYLPPKLESRLKTFVIQTSLRIYRDFERSDSVIGLANRRQLLNLLETISNRPYATSTSELAQNIFEMAERMESDPEIKYLCRRAVKFGLAHRPIVVSSFDVFDFHASALQPTSSGVVSPAERSNAPAKTNGITESTAPSDMDSTTGGEVVVMQADLPSAGEKDNYERSVDPVVMNGTTGDEVVVIQADLASAGRTDSPERSVAPTMEVNADDDSHDEQVQSYLDLFVDKPATTLPAQSLQAHTNGDVGDAQPLLNKP